MSSSNITLKSAESFLFIFDRFRIVFVDNCIT